jgi:predicted transcriptional regulator
MTTTIKVSDELRDRLKDQASRDGLTLGAHLARLADAEDRRRRLESVKQAIARTSSSGLEEYAAETAVWDETELPAAS